MCVLVVKNAGIRPATEKEIRNCAVSNPDGFGIAYVKNGNLYNYHTFDVDEIIEINKLWIDKDTPCIYHFRIATHGSVGLANCHPFVDECERVAFAHNGVLSIQNEGDMTDSETAFRRLFIPIIEKDGIESERLDLAVQCVIGTSKFAFLNDKGVVVHYGKFIDEDGLLFSNTSYMDTYSIWDNLKPKAYTCNDMEFEQNSPYENIDYYRNSELTELYYELRFAIEAGEISCLSKKERKHYWKVYKDVFPNVTKQEFNSIIEDAWYESSYC